MANPIVEQTIQTITKSETVIEGATTLIKSFPKMLNDGIAKALANGATAEQLAPLSDLSTEFNTKIQELQDAILANTPEEE